MQLMTGEEKKKKDYMHGPGIASPMRTDGKILKEDLLHINTHIFKEYSTQNTTIS